MNANLLDGLDSTDFLRRDGTVVDADTLDGLDSTDFLGSSAKAADADKLDSMNSSDFLGVNGKAADADKLDSMNSSDFLGVNGKAADADKLDGRDSAGYLRSSTYVRFATGFGTNSSGNACAGNQTCFLRVTCDATDTLITGGFYDMDPGTSLTGSRVSAVFNLLTSALDVVSVPYQWQVDWANNSTPDTLTVHVICARGRATTTSG